MNVEAYLDRLHYDGPRSISFETLQALQEAHLLSVPFENLSIHAGEPIVLDDEALFEKIVLRRRGGFCYELNGLFAALLENLGFDVSLLSAGVMGRSGDWGPDFDHMALMVSLGRRWLVDVGFGDLCRGPLLLEERVEQLEGEFAFKIEAVDGDLLALFRREGAGPWIAQYRFGLGAHELAEFAGMCHYHQTSPSSHFTQKRVCSMLTPDGRVTLSELRLITTRDGHREEHPLEGETEFRQVLLSTFGIRVPGD